MNNIALTPPMGWNSWDCYGASITEAEVRKNAEFIAKYLKPFGWEYLTIDIQWSEPNASGTEYNNLAPLNMDEYGRLIPAVNRFPSAADEKGFSKLTEYIHRLGLKFGIHVMRGIPRQACYADTPVLGTDITARKIGKALSVCAWNGDMYGVSDTSEGQAYYNSIFSLYAEWGVDLVKVDDLSAPVYHADEIAMIRNAIDRCGRDIVFSASPGATPLECAQYCCDKLNMWRISNDFWDDWNALLEQFQRLADWNRFAGPGHFPDADMIPIGALSQRSNNPANPPRRSHFTPQEAQTLMTLWCIARSPLILGCETTMLEPWELSLLTNAEVLSLNQRGERFAQVQRDDSSVIWRSTVGNTVYAALFNISEKQQEISLSFADCGAPQKANLYDVWNKSAIGCYYQTAAFTLPPHSSLLIRFDT